MEAGFFGEGNELVGRDETADWGCCHRASDFEAAEQAGAKLDQRLKIRNNLVLFERPAEIVCVFRSHG